MPRAQVLDRADIQGPPNCGVQGLLLRTQAPGGLQNLAGFNGKSF